MSDDEPVELDAPERALERRLEAEAPAPRPGLRDRVRRVVRAAVHRRVLRRRSAVLLTVGWAALAVAAVIAVAAPPT